VDEVYLASVPLPPRKNASLSITTTHQKFHFLGVYALCFLAIGDAN